MLSSRIGGLSRAVLWSGCSDARSRIASSVFAGKRLQYSACFGTSSANSSDVDPGTPTSSINLNIRGLPTSPTVTINEMCDEMIAQGKDVYKLGLGQSPFPVFPPVVEELRKYAGEKDYLPVKGLHRLRSAVASYHNARLDRGDDPFSADSVIIGPGSKELMFILQLAYYGCLLIPTPSWVSYEPQAQIIGRPIRRIQSRRECDWMITGEDLERWCLDNAQLASNCVLILNYPSNPTGQTYTREQLRDIALVAKEHRVLLLSDEIYGETHHTREHASVAQFYPEGTIISSGLSKWCGAGGWRLGTFAFPRRAAWLLDAMATIASETFTSTSAPIQHAAVRAFTDGNDPALDRYLSAQSQVLRSVGKECAKRLRSASIDVDDPQGGFYLFPHFPRRLQESRGILSGRQLCNEVLRDTGVAFLPGENFGAASTSLLARMAYVNFDGGAAQQAAYDAWESGSVKPHEDLPLEFLEQYTPDTLEAIDRVVQWTMK